MFSFNGCYGNYFEKMLQVKSLIQVPPLFRRCYLLSDEIESFISYQLLDDEFRMVDTLVKYFVYCNVSIFTIYGLHGIYSACHEDLVNQHRYVNDPELRQALDGPRVQCPIDRCFIAIITINILVYSAWKIERLHPYLAPYMLISTDRCNCTFISLFLSSFSHIIITHLIANMISFYSSLIIWKNTTHSQCTFLNSCNGIEFICFYISSALVSGIFGFASKVFLGINRPSHGASGVVCSLVGYQLRKKNGLPVEYISIELPSGRLFNYNDLLELLLAAEIFQFMLFSLSRLSELNLGFKVDHAVHIGGYMFGIWYAQRGDFLLRQWGRFFSKVYKETKRFFLILLS